MKNITLKQWEAHPSFQADLATLLENEVIQVAFQVLVDAAMKPVPKAEGATLTEWQFMVGSKREGVFETLQFLRWLATPPKSRPLMKKPWDSDKPQPPGGAPAAHT